MSSFPTGVAVVTTLDTEGLPRGMTCNSVASVTLTPPTLLVSLRAGSATLEAVVAHGSFAVNLLHSGGQRTAELFAGPDPDRFSRVCWRRSPSGLPHLADAAFAVADCRVSGLLDVGDHTVVFGEVGAISHADGTPLLYGLRRFTAWPHQ
ncbi:flavin reductase family protein [Streptomyces sp. HUAS TT7]|uniref:flavin reductase family protein n=1 Tax=Streptomyces sp. HUAS TT7 TaxID=3447507 RepID=UPI003F6570D3